MKDQAIDCVIIDDEKIALDRLEDILTESDVLEVVGTYSSYNDALENLLLAKPTLVFLDVELDRNNTAFELIDQIHSNCYFPYWNLRIILLMNAGGKTNQPDPLFDKNS